MLMDLMIVLKWVKSVIGCVLYMLHLDINNKSISLEQSLSLII